MPAKETRKIMKHSTSGVIALPKAYRDYHGLDHGTEVTVLYDSLLLIVPKSLESLLQKKAEVIDQLLGQGELRHEEHTQTSPKSKEASR